MLLTEFKRPNRNQQMQYGVSLLDMVRNTCMLVLALLLYERAWNALFLASRRNFANASSAHVLCD